MGKESFNPADLVRSHIREMPAYEPILPFEVLSSQLDLPIESLVKLDANENPYGALPEVRRALVPEPAQGRQHPHRFEQVGLALPVLALDDVCMKRTNSNIRTDNRDGGTFEYDS